MVKIGDGSTEFRVVTFARPGVDMNTNQYSKWLEQHTGVKVKYQTVPEGADGSTKINAIMAGGELPDAFMIPNAFNRSQVYAYGQQGIFQPVDKLIDQYAPQASEIFKMFPEYRDYLTTPDGVMYGFPKVQYCYNCVSTSTRTWINTDWLSKVGMEKPKTIDDLRKTLMAFKTKNPSGLQGAMPYAGHSSQWLVGYFMQSFLYTPQNWLIKMGDELVFTPTNDAFREGLKFIRGLVMDGLIDSQSWTRTSEQLITLAGNKKGSLVGMAAGNSPSDFCGPVPDWDNRDTVWFKYDDQPPVTGPDGTAVTPWGYDPPVSATLLITNSCKDPQTLVRWGDAQMNLEATLAQQYGPLKTGFKWAPRGAQGFKGGQATFDILANSESDKNAWQLRGLTGMTPDVINSKALHPNVPDWPPAMYKASDAAAQFASPKDQFFQEPYYDADQSAQVGELTANLSNNYAQATARFCLGQDDINDDAVWNAYKDKFNKIGVEQYLEIQQAALESSQQR